MGGPGGAATWPDHAATPPGATRPDATRPDTNARQRIAQQIDTLDRAVYEAIAAAPTPTLDPVLTRLSDAADHSKLWLSVAGVLAIAGGRRGRQAALVGVTSIGVTSLISNVLIKGLVARRRPDRADAVVPEERWVHMPRSRSFPSGHSASAFAFASAVGTAIPALSLPLHFAAVAVAYSRVHTGVHYPGDTIAGALLGTATATVVRHLAGRRVGPTRTAGSTSCGA